jgi:hypothetical protein
MIMTKEDFKYVDMHRSDANGQHYSWKRVLIKQVPALVEVYVDKGFNLYTTIQKFANKEHEDPEEEYCNLGFDFDSSSDVGLAYADAKVCVDHFIKVYDLGVSHEEMMIYFSGNRGFHITINPEVFNAEPCTDMIKIWRLLVNHINKELKLNTLDLAVYTKRRAWRIPNTKHTKTGLYKLALTYEQFNSSLENIRELAKSPCDWIDLVECL